MASIIVWMHTIYRVVSDLNSKWFTQLFVQISLPPPQPPFSSWKYPINAVSHTHSFFLSAIANWESYFSIFKQELYSFQSIIAVIKKNCYEVKFTSTFCFSYHCYYWFSRKLHIDMYNCGVPISSFCYSNFNSFSICLLSPSFLSYLQQDVPEKP